MEQDACVGSLAERLDLSARQKATERDDSGLRASCLNVTLGDKAILRDVSLHVGRAEHVLLLGDNGSGKSTLLRTIAGLIEPSAGDVCLDGRSTRAIPQPRRHREYAYMPAQGSLLPASCAENIELVLR